MAWGSPKLLACQPVIYAKVYAKREGASGAERERESERERRKQREREREREGERDRGCWGEKRERKLAWNVAK